MWAGLWQVPTIEQDNRPPTRAELARAVGLKAARLAPCGGFTHVTTHREVRFEVFAADWAGRSLPLRGGWVAAEELHTHGMSNAQKRVLKIARQTA